MTVLLKCIINAGLTIHMIKVKRLFSNTLPVSNNGKVDVIQIKVWLNYRLEKNPGQITCGNKM